MIILLVFFFYCDLYNEKADFEKYMRIISFGGAMYSYVLPPSRHQEDEDGQLKVLVDLVLAVSEVDLQDGDDILCVGTSYEEGTLAGLSYDVFPLMTDKQVHVIMLDPNEVEMEYQVGSVKYEVKRGKFDYNPTRKRPKLFLDDSWVLDENYQMRDPGRYFARCENFSVKMMPMDVFPQEFNVYKEALHPVESRCVSRPVEFKFRDMPLGNCKACRELKYLLKKDYGPEFYEFIMSVHKVNCMNKQPRDLGVLDVMLSARVIDLYQYKVKEFFTPLYSVPWDNVLGTRKVYPGKRIERGGDMVFLFSTFDFVTKILWESVQCFVEYEGTYLSNRFINTKENMNFGYVNKITLEDIHDSLQKSVVEYVKSKLVYKPVHNITIPKQHYNRGKERHEDMLLKGKVKDKRHIKKPK